MKKYIRAELETIFWKEEDIVRTSGDDDGTGIPKNEDELPVVPFPSV